jgi:pimeloyl-ACP methyl ester carboxylesterase
VSFIRIGGKQISYWIGRKNRANKKETILFIHGAGGSQFVWSCQKNFFEKEFSPVLIELPGHGGSEGDGEDEVAKYAGIVNAFLGAMDLERIFLVGHSMGGAIVQTMALTRPEGIEGIILAGTGARLRVLPMILDGIRNRFEETIRGITRFAYSGKAPPEVIERGILELMKCRPEVLYGDFRACDQFDLSNEVRRIELPALIICGSEDELTPVKYSQYLQGQIKGSRLEILPGAGHMVMMESPEAFNERIREFIVEIGYRASKAQGVK